MCAKTSVATSTRSPASTWTSARSSPSWRRVGLLDGTLLIVSGDNGGALFRGKGTLYDLGLRVPFVAHWPGHVPPSKHSAALTSGEDLAPTVLEAAGVAIPKDMTGKSFLDVLRGKNAGHRQYVFGQRGAHGSGLPGNSSAFDLGRCVISERYKLIYNALGHLPYHPVDFANDALWKELKELHASGQLPTQSSELYFKTPRPCSSCTTSRPTPTSCAIYTARERSTRGLSASTSKPCTNGWCCRETSCRCQSRRTRSRGRRKKGWASSVACLLATGCGRDKMAAPSLEDVAMTPEQVEARLIELIHRQPFVPFIVDMADGASVEVGHPRLAINATGAGFLGPDGALVDLDFKAVRAIRVSPKGAVA